MWESEKKSGTAREARDLCFRVREERGFLPSVPTEGRAPLIQAPERGTSRGYQPRDGHEPLTLWPLPPRILCASAGHYPYIPGSLCITPLPGSHDPGTTSRGEHTACLRLLRRHAGLCCLRLTPHSNYDYRTLPLPSLSEQESPNQLLL